MSNRAVLMSPTLTGRLVQLRPLVRSYRQRLVKAATEDRSSYDFTFVPHDEASMDFYLDWQLETAARGDILPFVQVRRSDEAPVGMTAFFFFRRNVETERLSAVEIGFTWLAHSAQRSGINVEAKLMLLTHAFEEWGVERVDLKTDARNGRSRTAIVALGARFEGVLRSWQPSQAYGEEHRLRDAAMYSIVHSEWPGVKKQLEGRLRAVWG